MLVGRAIGGGDVKAAKRCAVATVAAAALCGCGVAAFLALYAGPLSKLYVPPKTDAGLAAATRKLLKVLAGFVAVNALNSSLMGVLAGLGRQAAAAAAQLTGYYLVGVPSWSWCALDATTHAPPPPRAPRDFDARVAS